MIRKDKEKQRVEREGRIRDSRYNRWYKMIKEEGISKERMGREQVEEGIEV